MCGGEALVGGARAQGYQTRIGSSEATTHRDCCRCTICQHQGMAGREVPSPLPRHPQHRHC